MQIFVGNVLDKVKKIVYNTKHRGKDVSQGTDEVQGVLVFFGCYTFITAFFDIFDGGKGVSGKG